MNGFFAILVQHPGFPVNKENQRPGPASLGETVHLVKVTAESFYPDKTVSKPRLTGHTGKRFKSELHLSEDAGDCLLMGASDQPLLQSDGNLSPSG